MLILSVKVSMSTAPIEPDSTFWSRILLPSVLTRIFLLIWPILAVAVSLNFLSSEHSTKYVYLLRKRLFTDLFTISWLEFKKFYKRFFVSSQRFYPINNQLKAGINYESSNSYDLDANIIYSSSSVNERIIPKDLVSNSLPVT